MGEGYGSASGDLGGEGARASAQREQTGPRLSVLARNPPLQLDTHPENVRREGEPEGCDGRPGGGRKLARAFAPESHSRTPARFCGAMPSTHTTQAHPPPDRAAAPKPTIKQMRYLRDLADRLGQSFSYPATRHQASNEIARLKALSRGRDRGLDRDSARRERLATSRDMAEQFGGDSRHTADEVTGYGASATWSHRA